MNDERVTSHNWRTNRKKDNGAKKGGFLICHHQNCDERMEMVKGRSETSISNGIPGNLPSSVMLKKILLLLKEHKRIEFVGCTRERMKERWHSCLLCFLSFFLQNADIIMQKWTPLISHSNTELWFILLFYVDKMFTPWGNNVHALSQPTVQFHVLSPTSTYRRNSAFSHDELCKSSSDDWKALIET